MPKRSSVSLDQDSGISIEVQHLPPAIEDPGKTYWDTLYDAVQKAWEYNVAWAEYHGWGAPEISFIEFWASRWTPMYATQTQRHNVKLKHSKKPERFWKWLQISIYRMDSGRYEVTSYCS